MDISKAELNDLNVYFKKEKIDLPLSMGKVSSNEIRGKQLDAENGFHSVHPVEYRNKKFIIKDDREIDNRFEKKALNFISGPFYSHMIKRLACLTPGQHACTTDPYYVTEKCHFHQCVEVSTVHEYIDDKPLADINENNAEEAKDCIIKLHNTDLAPDGIHPGNLIRTLSSELRVIDLLCEGIMKIYRANDVLTLRNKYDIDIQGHSLVYNLILLKEKLRRFPRKVRGK